MRPFLPVYESCVARESVPAIWPCRGLPPPYSLAIASLLSLFGQPTARESRFWPHPIFSSRSPNGVFEHFLSETPRPIVPDGQINVYVRRLYGKISALSMLGIGPSQVARAANPRGRS